MRVLIVTALPPKRSSFLGRTLPLARSVRRGGHAVEIVTLSGVEHAPFDTVEHLDDIPVRIVGPNIRATRVRKPSIGETWRRLRAGRRALSDALAAQTTDVVVLAKPQLQNTEPTLAFARARGIPLLLDADDCEPAASRFPAPVRWFMQTLERRAARAATVITACSPFLVGHYQRILARPARYQTSEDGHRPTSEVRPRVELLPTGIEPRPTSPVHLRERLGIPPEEKLILYIGSLSLSSGHRVDALLEAFERVARSPSAPRAHLILAGDGLDERALRARAAGSQAAARIRFLGRFTPPLDLALAREADLLVDPVDQSPANEAKSSHRTMLALATGTPIVAGDVGIRRYLLPPALHEPCLYNPADPEALPAAIARGLADDFAPRFRAASEGRITQWTWNALGAKFCSLLDYLAASRAV